MKTKVLIVDDHEIVRQGLRAILETDPKIEVAGEAADGEEALTKTEQIRPDVVLMDIRMPGMDGRIAARKLWSRFPNVKVVILSTHDNDELVREMVFAGVAGYLVKQSSAGDLLHVIHNAKRGETLFSRCIMERFQHEKHRESITGRPRAGLTDRERQVLAHVGRGFSNRQIGIELGISIKTVEKHRQAVMEKTGIHEIAGLTRYAVDCGLLPVSEMVEHAPDIGEQSHPGSSGDGQKIDPEISAPG